MNWSSVEGLSPDERALLECADAAKATARRIQDATLELAVDMFAVVLQREAVRSATNRAHQSDSPSEHAALLARQLQAAIGEGEGIADPDPLYAAALGVERAERRLAIASRAVDIATTEASGARDALTKAQDALCQIVRAGGLARPIPLVVNVYEGASL